jgi:hypothetical protein
MEAAVSISLPLSSHEGMILGLKATGTDQDCLFLSCAIFQVRYSDCDHVITQ